MKKIIVLLLSFVLLVTTGYAQAKKKGGKLDKKTYTCTFLQAGGKDAFQDELKFSSGTFTCGIMLDDGFRATTYEATVDSSTSPPTTTFTCDATNKKGDVYSWTGTVTGDDMVGSGTLSTSKGKVKKKYTFDGSMKGKKAKTEYQ